MSAPPERTDETAFESRLTWILGSPRTGSSWLLRMLIHPWKLSSDPTGMARRIRGRLARYPGVVPINEPLVANHLTPLTNERVAPDAPPEALLFKNEARRGRPAYLFSDAYEEEWRPIMRNFILRRLSAQVDFATAAHGLDRPPVVIKEPNGSHGSDLVMSLLPRARMVFLMRDGRDVIDSDLARRSNAARPGYWEQITTSEERLAFISTFARLWVLRMRATERAYTQHPKELAIRVRYEDLLADTLPHLRRLSDWMGIERSERSLRAAVRAEEFARTPRRKRGVGTNRRAATPGLWRNNLSPEEVRLAEGFMGETLAELGYPV